MRLLRTIVTGVVKPEVTGKTVRPRLIRGGGQALLAVFNDTPKDQSDRILLPPEYRGATDIHSGKEVVFERHSMLVTVPYQDVVVLRLS
jgi:hypothetical protein